MVEAIEDFELIEVFNRFHHRQITAVLDKFCEFYRFDLKCCNK